MLPIWRSLRYYHTVRYESQTGPTCLPRWHPHMSSRARIADTGNLSAFSQSKRKHIVDGALRVFLERGYEGTSMNLVAEESGVIKQTIYSHFNDKESLFKAIIEKLTLEHFRSQIGDSVPVEQDPRVVLRKLGDFFISRQKDPSYIALMRTVIGESARFPELARLYTNTVIGPGMKMLTAYFAAHPELKLKDEEAAARIFCGSLVANILVQEVLYGKEIVPIDLSRIVESLISMILNQ